MSTYETPSGHCPACGKRFDRATRVAGPGGGPGPGDWSACIGCGTALRYTDDLLLRLALEEDLAELSDEERAYLEKVQSSIRSQISIIRWNQIPN